METKEITALGQIEEIEKQQWVTAKCPKCFGHSDKTEIQLLLRAFHAMRQIAVRTVETELRGRDSKVGLVVGVAVNEYFEQLMKEKR